jgi:hypothetical protein
VQIGGGFDFIGDAYPVTHRFGTITVRIQFDYRQMLSGGPNSSGTRFLMGVVLGPREGSSPRRTRSR